MKDFLKVLAIIITSIVALLGGMVWLAFTFSKEQLDIIQSTSNSVSAFIFGLFWIISLILISYETLFKPKDKKTDNEQGNKNDSL
ncbi:MAG: hypothetical protein KGV51_00945 [Moraxellaceae bacterium]|nr:hypothetical protein [Moraxellaceae bacterium]